MSRPRRESLRHRVPGVARRAAGLALLTFAVLLAVAAGPEPDEDSPGQAASPSHDWRAAGYVADVGGQLFDPGCRPLRSAGANVPNLPYRDGAEATLEWLYQHHFRWLRVFATGHDLRLPRAPLD